MTTEPGYYRPRELAVRLNVSEQFVRRLIADRWLPSLRIGRHSLVPRESADAWIAQHTTAAKANAVGYPCATSPGGRCLCKCHAIRLATQRHGRKRSRPDVWTDRDDDLIRSGLNAGARPADIAATLSARTPHPRTEDAVRRRVKHLGLSLRDGWWSRSDAWKILGISERRMKTIENEGLLPSEPYGHWRRITDHQLRAFVTAHAGSLFDPRRVKDPALRSLAEMSAVVNQRRQAS